MKGKNIICPAALSERLRRISVDNRRRLVWYLLIPVLLLPLIPLYIFCPVDLEYPLYVNYIWLICVFALLDACLRPFRRLRYCLLWPLLLLCSLPSCVYYMLLWGNGGGLNFENVCQLTYVAGWLDVLTLDPLISLAGALLTVAVTVSIAFFARVIGWSAAPGHHSPLKTIVFILLIVAALFSAPHCNPALPQMADLFRRLKQSAVYCDLSPEDYAAAGIKCCTVVNGKVTASPGKNLVFIILESTENTFLDQQKFPGLLPNLYAFSRRSHSFENVEMARNSSITANGIYAAMLGAYMTPVYLRHNLNDPWLPGVGRKLLSLPRILHAAGYTQHFIVGHSGKFAGLDTFAADHDYNDIWCGVNDRDIWEAAVRDSAVFARVWEDFQRLAAAGAPFHITALTVDAHGPDGHYSPDEPAYPQQGQRRNNLYNAMYASDHALGILLRKIGDHPAGRNTCIVIISDHLAHAHTNCIDLLKSNPARRLLFLIGNPVPRHYDRQAGGATFDIGPTVLDAMGVKHNYTFPLGESLYAPADPRRLRQDDLQEHRLNVYTIVKSTTIR